MKNIVLSLFAGILVTLSASGQSLKKADAYYRDFEFEKAIEAYTSILEKDEKAPKQEIEEKIALSYVNLNKYTSAMPWFEKLYNAQGTQMAECNFIKYIECLRSNYDTDKAMQLIKEYYKNNPDKLRELANQKRHLDSIKPYANLYEITDVEGNTAYSDYGTSYYKDKIVFSSTRSNGGAKGVYSWNQQPYLNIFVAERNFNTGALTGIKKLSDATESKYHDASLVFSKDYKTVYFTRNYFKRSKLITNKENLSNTQILMGTVDGEQITNITALPFNSPEYNCGHPALSADGKYLYFVSDMPGGFGATDVYVAEVFNGTTNTPVNLGAAINTAGNEMFPTVVDSILYFSSNGHYGFGGLDIYQTTIKSKKEYTIPLNLGEPINSNMDDFNYIFDAETSTGYFSSNRAGGVGDDDIYFFVKKELIAKQVYSGYVLDSKTNAPIEGASAKLQNVFNEPLEEVQTNADGFYTFTLLGNTEYHMLFTKEGYNKKNVTVVTDNTPNKVLENNNVYLTKFESIVEKDGKVEKISVNPIYFDYDKYAITPKAEEELAKVLFAMKEFPDIKIKIESHTDSRGSDSYNLVLSDNRAKATQQYLIANGIDASRIESAIGYGETRLINKCANGVQCTNAEHGVNRRSDFIIISK